MIDIDRRRSPRKEMPESGLGTIHRHIIREKGRPEPLETHYPIFVGIHNVSDGGLLLELTRMFDPGAELHITLYDYTNKKWASRLASVTWTKRSLDRKGYLTGLKYLDPEKTASADIVDPKVSEHLCNDIDFLLETKFLKYIPRHAVWPLLNCLCPVTRKAGAKLMSQGEAGEYMFLIQEGDCAVTVEKDGNVFKVARLGAGDVVGEMAVLTGEPRYADVVAETDMKLWELGKRQFDIVAASQSDLLMFLTDLVTRRFETGIHTADRTIGKYVIKHKLGQGAWSIVYQGKHKILNMTVAIKMLKHQMAMDPDFAARFKNEANIIAQLNHKNIVQIYDIEELYKTLFIVMEYLEGESLENMLKRLGSLSYELTMHFLIQICQGLAYAHGKGIIHQDIKPANILVMANNQIKIVDFGLACNCGSAELDLEGTVYYMAPEQIEGLAVDARTDIYNLGITTYEIVTGRRPYPEDDLANLMDLHLSEDIPDPALLKPDIPVELNSFIVKACQRSPEKRFQSMDEVLGHLLPLSRMVSNGISTLSLQKGRMTSLFLFFQDEHRGELNRLLEEFTTEAQELGIIIKAAEFKDV